MAIKAIAQTALFWAVCTSLSGFSIALEARNSDCFSMVNIDRDTIPKDWYGTNPEEFDRPYFKNKSQATAQDGVVPREYSDLAERGLPIPQEEEEEETIFYQADVTRIGQRVIPAVAEDYSGFRVQILLAETPLPPDHIIFTRHGSIAVEQLSEGVYAYLVGDFPSEEAAVEFTDVYLAPLYPGLRVVQFENGKRKF